MENYDRYEIIKDEKGTDKLLLFRNDKLIDTHHLKPMIEASLRKFGYTKI